MSRKILATLVLLVCVFAVAQTNDVDKQKLIDIEQKFAAITSFNSPEMTDAFQKYLYDGTSSVVVLFGHLYHGPKSEAVAATKKPDPNDPDVKMANKLSDLQVDTYGDTALVSYKAVETDRESARKSSGRERWWCSPMPRPVLIIMAIWKP